MTTDAVETALSQIEDDVVDIKRLKLRLEAFPPEVRTILEEPVDPAQISVTSNGRVYMTHIWYREKFNRAFGYGAWTVLPLCDWVDRSNKLTRDYGLFIGGRYNTEASSSHPYYPDDDLGEARESVRSGAYARLGKDLGIAKELWDRPWVAQFVRANVVCVGFLTRKKKKDADKFEKVSDKYETIVAKGFRLKSDMPLEGEVGPFIGNARGFYDDNAPRVPVIGERFAPYELPEGFRLAGNKGSTGTTGASGSQPSNPTGKPAEAPTGQIQGATGQNPPDPEPPLSLADSEAQAKPLRRFVYDQLAAAHGKNPEKLGELLGAMTKLVLGVSIRSYQQLNLQQARKLREAIDQKKFDCKSMAMSS